MIKCKSVLIAQSIVIDQNTNNVSVFNIIEQFASQTIPFVFSGLASFFLLTRDKGDDNTFECFLVLKSNKKEVQRFPLKVDFEGKARNRLIVNMQGVVIPETGIFSASLISGKKQLAIWNMEVKKIGGPTIEKSQLKTSQSG